MRFLTNYFLPGVSIISLLYSIGDVCQDTRWLVGFFVLSGLFIIGGALLIYKSNQKSKNLTDDKKQTKSAVSWVMLISGCLILGTLLYDYHILKESAKRNELWRDTLRKNHDEGMALTDLERSASLDNDARSQYTLAHNLLYGENGYDFDIAKAKEYAQKSADQGNAKANALLAVIYSKGLGNKPDYQQALSNIRLALKGGYEQGLSLLPLIDSTDFKLSQRDSIDLQECIQNRAFLDSLYSIVTETFSSKGMSACYPIVRANKERCLELSDKGYYRATDLLYFDAFGDPSQEQLLHQCAMTLAEQDRIPDMPTMRAFFLQALNGPLKSTGEKDLVESAITDNNFWTAMIWDDFDKRYIPDLTSRYDYNLAFYERSKYLLANQDNLNSLFFGLDEDPLQMNVIAKSRLSDCTQDLKQEMQKRPYLFAK